MAYPVCILDLAFPWAQAVWQAHVGGLVGGALCGWVLRNRPATLTAGGSGPDRSMEPGAAETPAVQQKGVTVPGDVFMFEGVSSSPFGGDTVKSGVRDL